MNFGVIGAGRWGIFQAWHIATYKKYDVLLYNLDDIFFQELQKTRKNDFLELPPNVTFTSDLKEVLKNEFIIISINAQNFKTLSKQIEDIGVSGKTFILAMKGIDLETKKRLSELSPKNNNVVVILGPGHVQDYTRGIYNCAVIDGDNEVVKHKVATLMCSQIMKIFYGNDLIGNEICAAYKNVIGIVAGILDGLGWQSVKGALMSRSLIEIARFIKFSGGNEKSVMGLSLLGDFEATLFSSYSNNRRYGENFVKGTADLNKNCEGYYTLKAVYEIGKNADLKLPITYTLHDIIFNKAEIVSNMKKMFGDGLENEF
jgi:glycerol-3-phosphate dehydrogenase (NAD(P)+)